MPFDAFEALGPWRRRRDRRDTAFEDKIGLPTGWGGPTEDEVSDYYRSPDPPTPSVTDEFRGTILDHEDPFAAWQRMQDLTEKPEKSTSQRFVEGAARHIFEAPDFVREGAADLANWIEGDPTLADVDAAESGDLGQAIRRPLRSFAAGAIQGGAELLNPFDVVTSLTGLSAVKGLPRVARSIEALQAAGSAFQTGAGLERGRRAFVEGDDAGLGQAAFETAMGAAGTLAGVHGARGEGTGEALRGNLLHPEGWRPTGTDLSTARWRPGRPPDIEADFWGPDGPDAPTGPPRGPAGYLADYAEGEVIPGDTNEFPLAPPEPNRLPPPPQGQLPAGRRFYSRGGEAFDAQAGDDLDAFLNPPTRFYGGRRGIADVEDVAGRTRVMGPTADMQGPQEYFDPDTGQIVRQQGPYGAIFDDANEAVTFPPEVAAERGIYPEVSQPIERLLGMPLIGADEPGPTGWRGTGAQRPTGLARQPVVNRTEQSGFNELAEFMGEGAPPARQQPDITGPVFTPSSEVPIAPPRREPDPTVPGAQPQAQPEATEIAPPKRGRGRGDIDPTGLSAQVRREIGRMITELEEFAHEGASYQDLSGEPGRRDIFANRPNAQGHYTPATPQSPLVDVLAQLAVGPNGEGVNISRGDLARRLRNAITNGRSDNMLDAAVKLAEAKLSGKRRIATIGGGLEIPTPLTAENTGDWALPEGFQPDELSAVLGAEPEAPGGEISWQEVEASGENLPRDFVYRWARGEVPDAEMRAALEEANGGELEGFFGDVGKELAKGGPADRTLTDTQLQSLDELAEIQERIYGEEGPPLANTPSDRRIGRPIEDFLPEGYIDDPEGAMARARARGEFEDVLGTMDDPDINEAVDEVLQHGPAGPPELLDEIYNIEENGSGESAASLEEIRRLQGMKESGQSFGVFDRAGNFRPLRSAGAVDYHAQPGETYGVLDERGFRILDNNGGRVDHDMTIADLDLEESLIPQGPDVYDLGDINDILDTGEAQPRLPGETGRVRDLDIATPQEDVPFSLGREANERPFEQGSINDLLRGEPPVEDAAIAPRADRGGATGAGEWPIARHGIEAPDKVDEIATSMARVGWRGRPALVIKRAGSQDLAWTATHRLEAARTAGLDYETQVPKVVVDGAALEAKGFNVDELSKLGKKKRIEALRLAGQDEAANLLEAERQGSNVRQEAAEAGLPGEGIADNVRDYLVKQLKYSPDQVKAMSPAEAATIGRSKRVNPNWVAPTREAPEVGLERLLESDPELASSYQRNIERIPENALRRNVRQQQQRVRGSEVYRGGLEEEAGLPAAQQGLPERALAGDVDEATLGREPRARAERPESALTVQERAARGLPAPAKEKAGRTSAAQSAARGQQDVIKSRAKRMGALLNDPSPANVDEYVKLLGEQAESQAKREFTGGSSTEGPKRHDRSGEYLASGLGGLEKLYKENPGAFWGIMRSSGGALIGALIDDEDPLRGAALGAVLAGAAPSVYSRLRTILRTGKLKVPSADKQDISWFRMISPSPERTVPDVFAKAQETFRELEAMYADPTRAQSANIAGKQLYLGDLAREIRELSVEARDNGMKRRAWYLNSLANAVAGVPTAGQRKVQEVGSRLLEGMGFSARSAPEPLHQSIGDALSTGRRELADAEKNYKRAKAAHTDNVQQKAGKQVLERSRIAREAAYERLQNTFKSAGERLREAAGTVDAEVGRTDRPGLVNQARASRTVGRKVTNYKSVKQALAAFDRLEGELGQGPLRVKPDAVESTVSKVVYRTLIGWAVDTAAVNLSQPILTSLWVKPSSILKGYRYSRTPKGKALAKEIELRTLVDDDSGKAVDERPLREIARDSGIGQAVKTVATDPSRPLRKTDNYNRRVSYLAALDHKGVLESSMESGRVPAEADAFARMVVRKTQGHTGPMGNNPFTRGPIGGSIKPFTKYPGLFLENLVDALNDPDAKGRAAVIALLGAALAAKGSGVDFEDMLISGGRPFGIDITKPGSLRPERVATATPVGRAVSDAAAHLSSLGGGERVNHEVFGHDADSFLDSDLAYLVFGRYPTKVAKRGVELAREGFGEHKGLRPSGEADPHTATEDLADLVGLRSTRVTEGRQNAAEAGAAVARSRRAREDTGAEARRLAVIALQRGDQEGYQQALQMMSEGQRRAFVRSVGRTRIERLEQQLPRKERPGFREQYGEDELENFLEGR